MIAYIALILAFVAMVSAGTISSSSSASGDVFVFAQSWQPGFCSGKSNYYGCSNPKDFWNKYFTIHGLWPQYSSGGYPHDCTTEAFNTTVPYEVGWTDMTTNWPNAQYEESDPNYDSFWIHEWSKHGTCTGLSQYDYFSTTMNLLKQFGTPALITNNVGGSVSASDLRTYYGGSTMVALQCNSGNYINGVYTCWNQVNGKPTTQVVCPSDVQKEDTCSGSTVYISSFK